MESRQVWVWVQPENGSGFCVRLPVGVYRRMVDICKMSGEVLGKPPQSLWYLYLLYIGFLEEDGTIWTRKKLVGGYPPMN